MKELPEKSEKRVRSEAVDYSIAEPLVGRGELSPTGFSNETPEQSDQDLYLEIENAAGAPAEVAERIVRQMTGAQVWPKEKDETERFIKAVTTLAQFGPQNCIESSLAVQMTATAEAALMFLKTATLPDQSSERVDRIVVRATRLMQLHLKQIEVMQKLKGKAGQQKVTVEHVHVHAGGQAIVGAISPPAREGGGGK